MPDDPRLTLAPPSLGRAPGGLQGAGDRHRRRAAGSVVAAAARTRSTRTPPRRCDDGSLRLDTAPYQLAPGVRAFGARHRQRRTTAAATAASGRRARCTCAKAARCGRCWPACSSAEYTWLRGNQPRCVARPARGRRRPSSRIDAVTIGLGAPGKDRLARPGADRHRQPQRPQARAQAAARAVPYDGKRLRLQAFQEASTALAQVTPCRRP